MRRRSLVRLVLALAAAGIVAALAAGYTKEPAASASDLNPPFCNSQKVGKLVRSFVRAYNRGDQEELDWLWVRVRFEWYSSTETDPRSHEEETFVTYSRRELLRYFADRHLQRDRLQLVRFRFHGFSAGWGHFSYRLQRRADDLRGGQWISYRGKGAASCLRTPNGLAIWTMAADA